MIYTSYFANLKKMPKDIIPIAICGKSPKGWKGLEYKKLAPKYWFFQVWKAIHWNEFYIYCYEKEVLDTLDPHEVVVELFRLAKLKNPDVKDIVLVCFEKSGDFCHRHLDANWLNDYEYEVKEWKNND